MKKWLLLLLLALPGWVSAQTHIPNDEEIETEILDPSSRYYYPGLLARYHRGDVDLNLEDYRHLYYGYRFDPDYEPFQTVPEADSIVYLIEHHPDLQLEELRRLVAFGNKVLEKEPFNLQIINLMTYAYGQMGDTDKEYKSHLRFSGIMDAILSSGEGTSEESPWHIIYLNHTIDIMDAIGKPYLKRMVISRTTEYVPLVKREGKLRGYYFDYSRVYTRPPGPKKPAGWELNGTPLP